MDGQQDELWDVAWLLERVNTHERSPKGFLDALESVEPNSTSSIFLNQDKYAWLAYHLSKSAADQRTHFAGQNNLRRKISDLEKTTEEFRMSIAKKVAAVLGSQVKEKIDRWWSTLQRNRPNKRRRLEDGISEREATSEGRRSPSPTSSMSSPTSVQGPSLVQPSFDRAEYPAENEHVLVNASLAEMIKLFPSSLSDAIKRIPDPMNVHAVVASVSMSFPNVRSRFGCQMALEIVGYKINNLARDLFNTRLETTDGLRYLCLPDGTEVLPNPELTLRGCRHDVIPTIFGPEIAGAVAESPAYQDDLKNWRGRTNCVWMVVSMENKAQLCLSMGLIQGTLIRQKLYNF